MMGYEFLLAFSAGLFTFISPCAFLLPAYVSYYLGLNPAQSGLKPKALIRKSLYFAGTMNLSIIIVFTVVGVVVSFLGSLIKSLIPPLQGIVGGVFIIMGIAMLKDWMHLPLLNVVHHGKRNIFAFGVLYTLAIVSCSAPIFISMITYTLSVGGTVEAMTLFWIYSLGIGLPLLAFTVLMVRAGEYAARLTEEIMVLRKLASVGLVAVGVYLIYRYMKLMTLATTLQAF
jgi:cytochrome c-type biogenesis protein